MLSHWVLDLIIVPTYPVVGRNGARGWLGSAEFWVGSISAELLVFGSGLWIGSDSGSLTAVLLLGGHAFGGRATKRKVFGHRRINNVADRSVGFVDGQAPPSYLSGFSVRMNSTSCHRCGSGSLLKDGMPRSGLPFAIFQNKAPSV